MLGLPRCQTKKKQTSRHQTLFQLERREKIGYFNDVKTEAHTVKMCCSAETKQVNGEKWRSCVLFVRNEKKTNTHSPIYVQKFSSLFSFFFIVPIQKDKIVGCCHQNVVIAHEMWPIQKILMAENSLFLIFIHKSFADRKWTKATDVIISGERQCQI